MLVVLRTFLYKFNCDIFNYQDSNYFSDSNNYKNIKKSKMPGIDQVQNVDPETIDEDYLADFPPGPLDIYRNAASFDWKVLKGCIEDEKISRFKHGVWKTLEKDPLFAHNPIKLSLEDERRVTIERALRTIDYDFLPEHKLLEDLRLNVALTCAIGLYDWSVSLRRVVLTDFFTSAVRGLGTNDQLDYIDKARNLEVLGCFCLTEISHGTDTKSMRTRATFDPATQKWILHTPDFEAAKCWAANLAKTATHGAVYAQLYTPDGECHGLHTFVVPLRDPRTMVTFPGVTIGDMGEKLGLNGLDNGYMLFDHYAIPKDCLLNKTGDVTPDGKYVTPYKDASKRMGASLGTLSAGRVLIVSTSVANLCKVIPIAIRYSAVRKQFGTEGKELPVIEYQMQQWRLFPYLAATYVLKHFGDDLFSEYTKFFMGQFSGENKDRLADMGAEIHAVSSSAKPLASWIAQNATQECREACGGHGYLRAAGIGQIRDDNDPNSTYEGDNNVLLQQTSNWLLSIWANPNRQNILKNGTPLGSTKFLQVCDKFHRMKFTPKTVHQLMDPTVILDAYRWLVCWLLESTSQKFVSGIQTGKDNFTSRNDSQVYQARTCSLAFIELFVLEKFAQLCSKPGLPQEVQNVFKKLLLLYGLWSLEKHVATLYQGGYAQGALPANLIREGILELCSSLKNEAVALVDVIAPTDFILNSALGQSDGQVYKNLQTAMQQTPNGLERPDWWKDVARRLQAKL